MHKYGYYRPVRLTSIVLKSLESFLRDGKANNLETNKFVVVEQRGF